MERIDAAEQPVTRLSALFHRAMADMPPGHEITPPHDPALALALERERMEVLAQARESGHAEGMKWAQDEIRRGVELAQRECEATHADALVAVERTREQLGELLQRLPVAIDAMEDAVVHQAAELAYEALLRVLGDMPADERLATVCRQALRERHQRPATVRLSETDAVAVTGLLEVPDVRVEADPRLLPGQCQIDTGLGVHDTGLDVRLDQLRQAFLRGLEAARG